MQRPLAAVLELEQLEERVFRGSSESISTVRVFGGQVAAQALVAAGRTLPEPRPVHSLHAYFLRPGDPGRPTTYAVEAIRDGRSFSTRTVVASQGDEAVFHLSASFHEPEDGVVHQVPTTTAPPADDLPTADEQMATADEQTRAWWSVLREMFPLDLRFVDEPVRAQVLRGERPPPRQRIYLRSATPLGDDPLVHVCALTYASDVFLLSTALPPHGLLMGGPDVHGSSLDHAMWFHARFRADEWLLYDMESTWAGDGRALCRGHLFGSGGRLVATVMQEGLLRRPLGKA
ncbi:MAG: acyl-CoA thioesterase [Actinomycetota bacterium]|nr:acyl-CoA thioesterase [Actinomycetota bacterium]